MNTFVTLVKTALYAGLLQNLVLTASLGLSETVKAAKRPGHFFTSAAVTSIFCVAGSVGCRLLDMIPFVDALDDLLRYGVYLALFAAVYIVSAFLLVHAAGSNKKFMNTYAMCCFNSLVISLPVLAHKSAYTLLQSLFLGLGGGAAFVIASLLINSGMKHIASNRHIPEAFRGTPAILFYTALLSLTLSCLTGENLFI